MSPSKLKRRLAAAVGAVTTAAVAAALLASPAAAASGQAVIAPADHAKGRTLSGQGVHILAGSGTSLVAGKLTLPVDGLEAGGPSAWAGSAGSLEFRKGAKSVTLTGIRFEVAAGALSGSLGGVQMPVFRLGGPFVGADGNLALAGGKLRLTAEAASLLQQKLGLERRLLHRGVGGVWLDAHPAPADAPPAKVETPPAAPSAPVTHAVVSGELSWGFLSSWRSYVLSVPPAGSQEVSEGATANGPLTSPATTYGFAANGGSYTSGTGVSELSATTAGAVKWAKPGHGIEGISLSDLRVEFSAAGSWLVADYRAEFGGPPTIGDDVRFASLDPSAVTPTSSAGGDSVIWTGVPATLTAEGAVPFGGTYEAGKALEPLTISVGLG